MNILQHALEYIRLGFSVFPLEYGKKTPYMNPDNPADNFQWRTFQSIRATERQARRWWADSQKNIAIVTGKISGIWALDIDAKALPINRLPREFQNLLSNPEIPCQLTRAGGYHLIFAYPDEIEIRNRVNMLPELPGIDARADGGYIVAAPSFVDADQNGGAGFYRWLENPIPVAQPAPAWLIDLVTKRASVPSVPSVTSAPSVPSVPSSDFEAYALKWARANLDMACNRTVASSTGRNDALNRASYRLGCMVALGWLDEGHVKDAMTNSPAARALLASGHTFAEVEKTVKSGLRGGREGQRAKADQDAIKGQCEAAYQQSQGKDTPRAGADLNRLPEMPAYHDFAADEKVHLRYISEYALPESGCFLVRSVIGTGKTELAKRVFERLGENGKGLYLTHRIALTRNVSDKLDLEFYKNYTGNWQGMINRLGMTVNSVVNLKDAKGQFHTYDVLVLDEIEQLLAHMVGGTLKNDGVLVHEAVRHLVKSAKLVICLDAHAGETAHVWLKSIRDDVQFVVNTQQPEKKGLTLATNVTAMLAKADTLLKENDKPVMIACGTRKLAESIYERYLSFYAEGDVQLITSHNSMNADVQAFLNHINTELPKKKLLIFSPSMGTGVDVTCPVSAIFGFFAERPITAGDMLQMIGRARNAEHYFAVVPTKARQFPFDATPSEFYKSQLARAIRTNKEIEKHINEAGELDISQGQKNLLGLFAYVEVHRQRSFNDLLGHFLKLATDQYQVRQIDSKVNEVIKGQLKLADDRVQEKFKALVLSVPALDPAEYSDMNGRGIATKEHVAGVARYEIENLYKRKITPEIYEHHEQVGAGALLAFCDLIRPGKEVIEYDYKQANEDPENGLYGVPIHFRKHAHMRKKLIKAGLAAVWGKIEQITELHTRDVTLEEIQAGMAAFLADNERDLALFFGRRASYSDDPLDVLRWLLGKIGLSLQLIRNQARAGNYRVEAASLKAILDAAKHRLENPKFNPCDNQDVDLLPDSAKASFIESEFV